VPISRLGLFLSVIIFIPLVGRLILAVRARVPVSEFLEGMWLHASLFTAALWPVVRRLLALRSPARQKFNVTGSSPTTALGSLLRAGAPAYVLVWVVTLLHITDAIGAVPNLVWLLPSAVAPLVLHGVQRG
jgi:hypothetical protein